MNCVSGGLDITDKILLIFLLIFNSYIPHKGHNQIRAQTPESTPRLSGGNS